MELTKFIQAALAAVAQGGAVTTGVNASQIVATEFDIAVNPSESGALEVDTATPTGATTLRLRFKFLVQSPQEK